MNNIEQTPSGLLLAPSLALLEDQAHVDKIFTELLKGHDNPHDGFGLLIPDETVDPELVREIQSIQTIAALGRSATSKDLVDFGKLLIPDIEDYIGIMLERKDLVGHLKDRLNQGRLVVATNHRDVIGVALALGMTSACLQENGVRADEFETDLAVSAMLKYVTTKNFPAVQSVQGLFSRIRFVISAGNPSVRDQLNPNYIKEFNRSSNLLLSLEDSSSSRLPIITAVAPSGTRDIHTKFEFPAPGKKARTWLMKRPSPNTIKYYFRDTVLGISLDLSESAKNGVYISRLHIPDPEIDLATRAEMIMSDLAAAQGKHKLESTLTH